MRASKTREREREKEKTLWENNDDDIETKNEVDGKRRTKLSGKDREI